MLIKKLQNKENTPTILEIKDLSHAFQDKKVYDNFNLTLKKNEKLIISGESGIGKTSLLKMIMGFIKPDKGEILFKDRVIDQHSVWSIRREIAYVPQQLNPGLGTVKEVIENILSFSVNRKRNIRLENIYPYLEIMHLERKILDMDSGNLSGGEKQRISIALSFLLDRELYLFDEITASLDMENKKTVIDHIHRQFNKTAIIIAHENDWLDLDLVTYLKI